MFVLCFSFLFWEARGAGAGYKGWRKNGKGEKGLGGRRGGFARWGGERNEGDGVTFVSMCVCMRVCVNKWKMSFFPLFLYISHSFFYRGVVFHWCQANEKNIGRMMGNIPPADLGENGAGKGELKEGGRQVYGRRRMAREEKGGE